MSTMQIQYASSPTCKAVIDGVEKTITILGNKGGNLLVKDLSDNSLWELKCPYGHIPSTYEYEVVWTDYVPPTPPVTKYTVTVTDSATFVTAVDPASKEVEEGENATFTLTYASGTDDSDVKASSGSISGTTLTVSSVSEDTTVTLTDLYTVFVRNFSTVVTTVTPASKKLEAGSNAVFALTFAEGKSASDIEVSGGTVTVADEGTYVTISNIQADTFATITDKE